MFGSRQPEPLVNRPRLDSPVKRKSGQIYISHCRGGHPFSAKSRFHAVNLRDYIVIRYNTAYGRLRCSPWKAPGPVNPRQWRT